MQRQHVYRTVIFSRSQIGRGNINPASCAQDTHYQGHSVNHYRLQNMIGIDDALADSRAVESGIAISLPQGLPDASTG